MRAVERLKSIQDFFFPILGRYTDRQLEDREEDLADFSRDAIGERLSEIQDMAYLEQIEAQARLYLEREEDRLKTVESKATLVLGAGAIAVTLIASFASAITQRVSDGPWWVLLVVLLAISGLYFMISALYSLKALKTSAFHFIGPRVVAAKLPLEHADYIKRIIAAEMSSAVANHQPVNQKVDCMSQSHKYFKRALLSIAVTAAALLLAFIVTGSAKQTGAPAAPTTTTRSTSTSSPSTASTLSTSSSLPASTSSSSPATTHTSQT
jgi:hypothetical protein